MIFRTLRRLLHSTAVQSWPASRRAYALYTRWLTRSLPRHDGMIDVPFRGCNLTLPDNDLIMLPSVANNTYEERELSALLGLTTHQTVFIDVGANVGIYSAVIATHRPNLQAIIALEPHPENLRLLRLNMARNGFPPERLHIIHTAVSDHTVGCVKDFGQFLGCFLGLVRPLVRRFGSC